ncbi:MAG: hypothetical protein ACKO7G_09820, partial [Gammaproteobacteria bacterium]
DVTVTDGKLALYGRTGVTAGKLTQSRTGVPPTAPNIDLLSAAGAITVGDVSGTGCCTAAPPRASPPAPSPASKISTCAPARR